MSDLDDFKATYFDECSELMNELEEQFAAIEGGERDADRLNAVFRAIHSIKGGAGAFGFSALVGFAHAYETLLDYVSDGRVEMIEEFDIEFTPVRVELAKDDAEETLAEDVSALVAAAPAAVTAGESDAFDAPPMPVEPGHWEVRFTPFRQLYSRANDPLLLFREL